MKSFLALTCVTLLATGVALAVDPTGDGTPAGVVVKGGGTHEAVRDTAWLIYDDGTAESSGLNYFPSGVDAFGNKFTSNWGTFYCDQLSVYWLFLQSDPWIAAWRQLNGTTLQDGIYMSLNLPTATAATWWFFDGSSTPRGFIGDTTFTWVDTAYIAADFAPNFDVGVDTTSSPQMGFSLTNRFGQGYSEGPFNAMIRARFNGDGVPVELMTFTAE